MYVEANYFKAIWPNQITNGIFLCQGMILHLVREEKDCMINLIKWKISEETKKHIKNKQSK